MHKIRLVCQVVVNRYFMFLGGVWDYLLKMIIWLLCYVKVMYMLQTLLKKSLWYANPFFYKFLVIEVSIQITCYHDYWNLNYLLASRWNSNVLRPCDVQMASHMAFLTGNKLPKVPCWNINYHISGHMYKKSMH